MLNESKLFCICFCNSVIANSLGNVFNEMSLLFNDCKFWFYNQEVYPDHYEKPTLVSTIDFKKEIAENEVIILLSTDANLDRFPFGFSELFIQYFPMKDKK